MLRFITIYPVNNFIPYKQTPEFLQYLAHRDGLLGSESEAHYYILHHQHELIGKSDEIIEPGLVRHFVYISPVMFQLSLLPAYFIILRQWKKFPASEHILMINNTFHQIGLHILTRLFGWQSLKIVGTFFHHARRGWKKYLVNTMEWLHAFFATRLMIISPSGWEYVSKKFHHKTHYYIPDFLYDAPSRTIPKTNSTEAEPYSAVCLSRLEPEKGLINLIEAWKLADPHWQLTIYGDGSLKQLLLDRIRTNGLSDRVTIHDPVVHSEVFSTLSRYSVFILTSPCEGLGICYPEALFTKTPCVGLRVPGVKDTLAEGRGMLLDPKDWMTKLNDALERAQALRASAEWHEQIESYFSTTIFPQLNRQTSDWFKK